MVISMNKEKILSVVICSYNGERCIDKAIQCITQANSFDKYVDKVVLVDNMSNDSTLSIMNAAKEKVHNICVVRETKPGLSNARLCGLNQVSSKWIAYIDDDNYIDSFWIENAVSYIESHKDVGIFGGSIVPITAYELSEDQRLILKLMHRSLAITHLDRSDIDYKLLAHPSGFPYGAGMVVRTDALRALERDGWLSLKGRNGQKLSSGEDTELGQYIKNQGFAVGYCPQMILEHDIPQSRLSLDYMISLNKGITDAVYYLSGRDRLWRLRRIKYCFRIIRFYFAQLQKNKTKEQEIILAIEKAAVDVLCNNLKQDGVLLHNRFSGRT